MSKMCSGVSATACTLWRGNAGVWARQKTQDLGCGGYREKRRGKDGKRCPAGDFVPFKEVEMEFLRWFVPQAKNALLGDDETQTLIETLTAKKDALQGKIEQTLTLLDAGLAVNEVKARLAKLEGERREVETRLTEAKAEQSSQNEMPETFKTLNVLLHKAIDGDMAVRRKIAAIVPTLVRDIKVNITDRLFPSFQVLFSNGKTADYTMTLVSHYGLDAYPK